MIFLANLLLPRKLFGKSDCGKNSRKPFLKITRHFLMWRDSAAVFKRVFVKLFLQRSGFKNRKNPIKIRFNLRKYKKPYSASPPSIIFIF